jgi:hypothetical protein
MVWEKILQTEYFGWFYRVAPAHVSHRLCKRYAAKKAGIHECFRRQDGVAMGGLPVPVKVEIRHGKEQKE